MDKAHGRPLRMALRIVFGLLLVLAFLIFVLWRTENPRLQGLRATVLDYVRPVLESVAGPSSAVAGLFEEVQSFSDLQTENEALRQEVERLRASAKEVERLEAENAVLRRTNRVTVPNVLKFVRAQVIADAGGPYGQTLLIGVGRRDGVADGAPALDDGALIGRLFGVGDGVARVLLLTDATSRIPVSIGTDRVKAILVGDSTSNPILQYVTNGGAVENGARVLTTGEGGVLPRGMAIGRVFADDEKKARVRLDADLRRTEFVTVLISALTEGAPAPGGIVRTPVVSCDLTPWTNGLSNSKGATSAPTTATAPTNASATVGAE